MKWQTVASRQLLEVSYLILQHEFPSQGSLSSIDSHSEPFSPLKQKKLDSVGYLGNSECFCSEIDGMIVGDLKHAAVRRWENARLGWRSKENRAVFCMKRADKHVMGAAREYKVHFSVRAGLKGDLSLGVMGGSDVE